ncbi:MAG: hypothetical protein KGD60_07280 [Candidatus Thorarchaeota archaeon]|nr:hypothetical protein [Candidatus Thorarchaeota archaeon]
MKRISILIIVSLFVIPLLSLTSVDAATGLDWGFEEGDFIDYRFISDGLVQDEIISFRIDSPLPDMVELPPDTYNLGALDNWMEIPVVPVTAFIPFGGSITEEDGFENIFTYGGLAAGYWCRFAVPDGVSNDTYAPLVERWTDGPHGAIEPQIIQPPFVQQHLYWGFEYGFEFLDTVYNVTAWYYQSERYLANVTIVGRDSTTHAQTNHMMLVTDWRPPTVSFPEDINFTVGSTGEEILWQVHDVEYPLTFEVYRNSSLILPDSIGLYDSRWIHFSLDELEIGVWNFTIVVTDFLFNSVSDTVFVTVKSDIAIGSDVLLIAAGLGAVVIVGVVIMMRRR